MPLRNKKTPRIIATGFTTALLGDERTLREFIIGDYVREKLERKGENVVLYLINDNYDPLNYRQLRIGVNKDEKLLKKFERYCGRPISEIPDPFDCHKNYSQHFAQALLKRLHSLDIYPVILNSYDAYKKGYYADFIDITFKNYSRIKEMLSQNFNHYTMKKLFYVQCPKCRCIDATNIHKVADDIIQFECERCKSDSSQEIAEVRGKLGWKLDCAARWNLYDIDIETFSKAHVAGLGSFDISRFISKHFYGGKIPTIIRYGDVKISRELSYKLLKILPPELIKKLFTAHITRDLDLNRESLEHFCCKFQVRPGLSYADYVMRELPKEALYNDDQQKVFEGPSALNIAACDKVIDSKTLVAFGNSFSMFYYNKDYGVRFPTVRDISSADLPTVETAISMIRYALSIRNGEDIDYKNNDSLIRSFINSLVIPPQTYQFLRRIFGQSKGPSIPTLLAILPKDYLGTIEMILTFSIGVTPTMDDLSAKSQLLMNDTPQEGKINKEELEHNVLHLSKLTNNLLEVIHETDKNISSDTSDSYTLHRMPEGS